MQPISYSTHNTCIQLCSLQINVKFSLEELTTCLLFHAKFRLHWSSSGRW